MKDVQFDLSLTRSDRSFIKQKAIFVGHSGQQMPGSIMKTHLFKYIENVTTKTGKFSDKNSDFFHISAQNIDCGYLLEPPH